MFVKGDPRINRKGRPKGGVDRKWNNVKFWFSMLETELNKTIHVKEYFKEGTMYREYDKPAVDSNTRAGIFLNAMKMLVMKMRELPKDPVESAQNVTELTRLLEGFEKNDGTGTPTNSTPLLANRPSDVQAKADTKTNTGGMGKEQSV